ncbi:DUF1214 domain-containing protein [Paraburkholderia phytofirmans]|jgi:hypothetical protein|uniref:DUF1214 domain-containing protein n=1 Tax=Paraburkholderia sp. BL9I2N2 TaxID=1938809 RepID=UPI0010F428F1|nr:DUF1214 domain-containing protein [Paraburkholderia sp. BL9I2N2]TCK88982.1 hypothetical protein B0G74_7272 [Paraburkholderia sp. BL9I2N2]
MLSTTNATRLTFSVIAAGLIGMGVAACSSPGRSQAPAASTTANASAPTDEQIVAAWNYLYGRYLVLQQENYDINVEKAGYNKIKYNPLGSAQFVNPNLDVAYLEAWLAADPDHAVILNVPKVTGRYYTAQLLDGWGEVITNINERTNPDHPYGKFALVIKGTNPPVPADAVKIELPSAKAKLLARVELKGSPETAVKLQHQFTVVASPDTKIDAPFPVPSFTPAAPIGAEIFDHVSEALATYPDAMPKAAEFQASAINVANYAKSNDAARKRVNEVVKAKAVPGFLQHAKGFGTQKGGWSVTYVAGKFGNDYVARDIVNYGGLWANVISEAIYFVGLNDSNNHPLDGSKTYEIRFPKGERPDAHVNGFWSVTLYSVPDYRVVPNALHRYNLNNVSHLKANSDGSTSIWLAPVRPKNVPQDNWLPTPDGKGFSLNFRTYVPKDEVQQGQWFPAPIVNVK